MKTNTVNIALKGITCESYLIHLGEVRFFDAIWEAAILNIKLGLVGLVKFHALNFSCPPATACTPCLKFKRKWKKYNSDIDITTVLKTTRLARTSIWCIDVLRHDIINKQRSNHVNIPGPVQVQQVNALFSANSGYSENNSDFAFFCVWTYVKSASSPFAQSFSHAKAQQWSDDILP